MGKGRRSLDGEEDNKRRKIRNSKKRSRRISSSSNSIDNLQYSGQESDGEGCQVMSPQSPDAYTPEFLLTPAVMVPFESSPSAKLDGVQKQVLENIETPGKLRCPSTMEAGCRVSARRRDTHKRARRPEPHRVPPREPTAGARRPAPPRRSPSPAARAQTHRLARR